MPPKDLLPEEARRRSRISSVCQQAGNASDLREFAIGERGFIDDEMRRKAWPILLHCASSGDGVHGPTHSWQDLPRHKDETQVKLDVNRAFVYYPRDEQESMLEARKQQLSDLIIQVLRSNPQLNYFQGYHDIAQVFLLVLGTQGAAVALTHLSFLHIRDFLLPSLSPSVSQLNLVPSILKAIHPKLFYHLSAVQPVFALSATITMYAHHVQHYGEIARLFDFLIAQPAVVSLYFFATIVSSRSTELFEIDADDPAMLHSALSKLPPELDFEDLISQSLGNFARYPPESFPIAWYRISSYSALKTTRWGVGEWTIQQGEEAFAALAWEINWHEATIRTLHTIWGQPARWIKPAMAISIGVISFCLAKYMV